METEPTPVHTGEQVALIGFPGTQDSVTTARQVMVTTGTVTEVDTPTTISASMLEGGLQETLSDAITVAATSEPGESGGLAIDAQGKVIGVIEGGNGADTILTPVSDLPLPKSAQPIGTTTLQMGSSNVVEPTTVAISGDGGNIVTNLAWGSWTPTSAVGTGTSDIQNCIPDCADGSNTPVTTTLALSKSQDGHFTQIVETRNGTRRTWTYPGNWPWTEGFGMPSAPPPAASAPGAASGPQTSDQGSGGSSTQCDANISVSGSECRFAENTFYEYWSNQGTSTFPVYSPADHTSYTVNCNSSGGEIQCVAANQGAVVTFSAASVAAYTQSEANSYASSHNLGP
jgi:hypothetical protein